MPHKATKGIPGFYDKKGELCIVPEHETHLLVFPEKHVPDYDTFGDTSVVAAHEINEGGYPLDIGPRGPLHPDFSEWILAPEETPPEETDEDPVDDDSTLDSCAAAKKFSHQPLDENQETLSAIVATCRDNSRKAFENPQLWDQNLRTAFLPLCCRLCLNLD